MTNGVGADRSIQRSGRYFAALSLTSPSLPSAVDGNDISEVLAQLNLFSPLEVIDETYGECTILVFLARHSVSLYRNS